MSNRRVPDPGPQPFLPWTTETPDGRVTIECRVFDVDPRGRCDLCVECEAVPVRAGYFACHRIAPDDPGPIGLPATLPFRREGRPGATTDRDRAPTR